jgi:hypothetical protein
LPRKGRLAQDAAMILATGQRGETMQAIELETRVQDGGVQLPAGARLADGQQVRVVLMYDEAECSHSDHACERRQSGRYRAADAAPHRRIRLCAAVSG